MRFALVTVSFNTEKVLLNTLASVYNTAPSNHNFDYFVIDNGSTDESLLKIRTNYPQVKIIEANENLGFGAAHNLFFDKYLSEYDYFFLVNPDMELTSDWLDTLLQYLDGYEKVAAVNPLILYQDQFYPIPLEIEGRDVCVYHEDYRFLSQPIGDAGVQTEEVKEFGLNFTKLPAGRYFAYLEKDKNSIRFQLYNMSFARLKLILDKFQISQSALINLGKKILYKLGLLNQASKLKNYNLRLDEVFGKSRRPAPVHVINSFGASIRPGNVLPDNNYFGQIESFLELKSSEVEMFHGACVALSAKALKQVFQKDGFVFDPQFFMFYEESDLSLRLRKLGWKIMATPEARVFHLERGTRSPKIQQFILESQEKFIQKWRGKIRT